MEITGRHDEVILREDSGVIGDAVDFGFQDFTYISQGIFCSAMNLRDTTERIWILHMGLMAFDNLAPFKPGHNSLAGSLLPRMRAHFLNLRIERLDTSVERINRQ